MVYVSLAVVAAGVHVLAWSIAGQDVAPFVSSVFMVPLFVFVTLKAW
jgi:hypothetical protein